MGRMSFGLTPSRSRRLRGLCIGKAPDADEQWPIGLQLAQNGEGHAVLTVRTDRGDYILDNLINRVRLWSETGYRYLKRQAVDHTGHWVSIPDGDETLVGSVQ